MARAAVRDAQHPRYDTEKALQAQDGPIPVRPKEQTSAPVACGRKGCYLPWDEHLTKAGKVRVQYKDHFAASAGTVVSRRRTRAAIEGRRTGFLRPRAAGRRMAPGSFATHVVVVGSDGKQVRMPVEQFAKLMEEYRQEHAAE